MQHISEERVTLLIIAALFFSFLLSLQCTQLSILVDSVKNDNVTVAANEDYPVQFTLFLKKFAAFCVVILSKGGSMGAVIVCWVIVNWVCTCLVIMDVVPLMKKPMRNRDSSNNTGDISNKAGDNGMTHFTNANGGKIHHYHIKRGFGTAH